MELQWWSWWNQWRWRSWWGREDNVEKLSGTERITSENTTVFLGKLKPSGGRNNGHNGNIGDHGDGKDKDKDSGGGHGGLMTWGLGLENVLECVMFFLLW
jgi:hypothetical protein